MQINFKVKSQYILVIILSLICHVNAYSENINLKNKDKINKEKLWKKKLSLGYNKSSGNTQNSQFSMKLYTNRKTYNNEFTIKGNILYSSSNEEMDAERSYGMVRYAFSFWERKWYNFYKIESDHDRFANINYRLIPSTGIGYWFSDETDWKAMVELALGLEHTDYKDSTKDTDEGTLIPRGFFEKKLFDNLRISQDLFFYPSLSNAGEYRFRSETTLVNPINNNLSLNFSLIDDYNSNPDKNTKKNDIYFISSITYSF